MVDSKGKKVEWLLTEQSVATAVALVTQEFLAGNYPGGVGHGSRSWIADMFLDLPAERLWMPYKVERSSRTNAGNLLRTALHQEERQDRDDYDRAKNPHDHILDELASCPLVGREDTRPDVVDGCLVSVRPFGSRFRPHIRRRDDDGWRQ